MSSLAVLVLHLLWIKSQRHQHDIENMPQLPQKPPRDSSQPAKHSDEVHPFAIQSIMLGRQIV